LKSLFRDHLGAHAPLHRLDYIECVDRDSLAPQSGANENSLLVTAVFFGATRLIDNLELV